MAWRLRRDSARSSANRSIDEHGLALSVTTGRRKHLGRTLTRRRAPRQSTGRRRDLGALGVATKEASIGDAES
jgi:hypothetical protein